MLRDYGVLLGGTMHSRGQGGGGGTVASPLAYSSRSLIRMPQSFLRESRTAFSRSGCSTIEKVGERQSGA